MAVANEWVKEWLENRLLATIRRTVTGVVGETAKVAFVTEEVWRLWQTALDALQSQVPQEVFDARLRSTQPLKRENGALYVAVDSAETRDWLEDGLLECIGEALACVVRRLMPTLGTPSK